MAAFISIQPRDNFNTLLYTGTGSSLGVTGVGFAPNLVWLKGLLGDTDFQQFWFDTVRGTTKHINANSSGAEATDANSLTSFDSDGFTIGTTYGVNANTKNFVTWNWKAATTTGLSGGTITPSAYYINVAAGFGIYKYTGTGANANIAHGLGIAPTAMIIKQLNTTRDWTCYHKNMGNTYRNWLNLYSAASTGSTVWNDTSPTSTLFYLGSGAETNESSGTYVAYVFAPIKGYSHFGSHKGHSSNADGEFVFTGFRPNMLFLKNKDAGDEWIQQNVKSSPYNPVTKYLVPDKNNAVADNAALSIDFLSNGFKIRGTSNSINYTTQTYIHWAWAEFPMVSSNDVPGVAR